MKYTKRITALLLTLVLCFGLTACGKDPSGSAKGIWVGANEYEGTFSDQGYYYVPWNQQGATLSYLDISTGTSVILCTKAGCRHTNEYCEAYFLPLPYYNSGGTCFWDGSLYYVEWLSADSVDLVRRNATGTERAVIGTLGNKYIEDKKTVLPKNFARFENFWYYCAEINGSVWDEATQRQTTKRVLDYIGRIDLRTGKEEILIEDRDNTLDLHAVKNDALVFSARGIPDADIQDRDAYREQLNNLPFVFQRWDAQTGQVSTLFEKYNCGVKGVYDDKLYYNESANGTVNLYTYDLNTGEDALFLDLERMWFWGGGYVQCKDSESDEDWYILELNSGKKLPIDIEGSLRFQCDSDQGCILQQSVKSADGGPTEHRVCYVPYTALADGLQEADLMHVYTWRNSM